MHGYSLGDCLPFAIRARDPGARGSPCGFSVPPIFFWMWKNPFLKIGSPEKVPSDLTACRSWCPAARKRQARKAVAAPFPYLSPGMMLMEICINGMLAFRDGKPSGYPNPDCGLALFNLFS